MSRITLHLRKQARMGDIETSFLGMPGERHYTSSESTSRALPNLSVTVEHSRVMHDDSGRLVANASEESNTQTRKHPASEWFELQTLPPIYHHHAARRGAKVAV